MCGFCRRADDPAGTDCNGACGEYEMRDGECVHVGESNRNVTNVGQQCDGAINE